MKKRTGILSGLLVLMLVLTACGGDMGKQEDQSRMVRSMEESGILEEWMGSGRYQADGRGRVNGDMNGTGRAVTRRAQRAMENAKENVKDAGRDLKQGAERAGQDMKTTVGK